MTAAEYMELEPDGYRYELIDGVVCMSPSPTPRHQNVATRIAAQLQGFLDDHPIGYVFHEIDVDLGATLGRKGVVYRPDVAVVVAEQSGSIPERIESAPVLVVEVLSPSTRQLDLVTKRADYARAGVREYWLVDPDAGSMTFLRLHDGQYVEIPPDGDSFHSEAVPGFDLNLTYIRRAFENR